jgi:hypothetical protein
MKLCLHATTLFLAPAGDKKALATVAAIIDGMGGLGAAVGPTLTGYLASMEGGFSNMFLMLTASALIAGKDTLLGEGSAIIGAGATAEKKRKRKCYIPSLYHRKGGDTVVPSGHLHGAWVEEHLPATFAGMFKVQWKTTASMLRIGTHTALKPIQCDSSPCHPARTLPVVVGLLLTKVVIREVKDMWRRPAHLGAPIDIS